MRVRLAGTTDLGDIEPMRRRVSGQLPSATLLSLLHYRELDVSCLLDPTRLLHNQAASVPPTEVQPSPYPFGPAHPRFLLSGNARRQPLGGCLVVPWRDRDGLRLQPTRQPVREPVTS